MWSILAGILVWIAYIAVFLYSIYCIWVLFEIHRHKYPFDSWSFRPTKWTWDDGHSNRSLRKIINTSVESMHWPKDFLWGTATAAHQIEGNCGNNNWAKWETLTKKVSGEIVPTIHENQRAGIAVDHWNRVVEDISLMEKLGCNSYRFSIEWSKIEPIEGKFDQAAIDHYHFEINELLKRDIVPMVTLHHFTHPLWFEELGSFENEENLEAFYRFCEKVFDEYSEKVRLWCTINEPEVFMNGGWLAGVFPPGKTVQFKQAGVVLRNLCKAHVELYFRLKQRKNGGECQIGIVKDTFQFHPWNKWNPFDVFFSKQLDHMMNKSILNFFRDGHFNWNAFGFKVNFSDSRAPNSLDFVGLNYYSHLFVQFDPFGPVPVALRISPEDILTDMNYGIYAEGFYAALQQTSLLRKPIYVTENGIADAEDTRRHLFLRRYLYAMNQAIKDGVDIRGYFYWSLVDNFEWAEGYSTRFGLYDVDFKSQKRTLRDGSKFYMEVIKSARS